MSSDDAGGWNAIAAAAAAPPPSPKRRISDAYNNTFTDVEEESSPPKKQKLHYQSNDTVIDLTLSEDEDDRADEEDEKAGGDDDERKPAAIFGRENATVCISLLASSSSDDDDDQQNDEKSNVASRRMAPGAGRKRRSLSSSSSMARRKRQRRHSHPSFQTRYDYEHATSFHDAVQRRRLSHQHKQEHFQDARRPQFGLERELKHLKEQKQKLDPSFEEYQVCCQQIELLEQQLQAARLNAARDIYNRNNSAAAGMGQLQNGQHVTIDFHGLYTAEAMAMFDEMVLPILPAVAPNGVAIITGKGKHSSQKKTSTNKPSAPPLRTGLVAHIQTTVAYLEGKLRYVVDQQNSGRLLVSWNE